MIEHVIRRNDWYVVVDKVAAVEQEVERRGTRLGRLTGGSVSKASGRTG